MRRSAAPVIETTDLFEFELNDAGASESPMPNHCRRSFCTSVVASALEQQRRCVVTKDSLFSAVLPGMCWGLSPQMDRLAPTVNNTAIPGAIPPK